MIRVVIGALAALWVGLSTQQAHASTELFISEYIEGSSNNKAVEIFNGTGADVDLAGYELRFYFNGSTSPGFQLGLTGTVADGDVFVVAHSSAVAAILDQADVVSGSGFFNGDDAVALVNSGSIIDVIGQIGVDPGSQWGSGDASTQDNTLRRAEGFCEGDPDGSDAFDPAAEWDGFAQDSFDGLGAHEGCAAALAEDLFFSEYIEGSSNNKALEIFNGTGADVALGLYQVQFYFNGSASAGFTLSLSGTVADGDVFVLAHSSAVAAILDQADVTSGASFFNGDDAIVLLNDGVIIDVIGQIGVDPGSQWGSGDASTQDNTLRRQGALCAGDADGSDAFDPAGEWDGFAQDSFDGLGAHEGCGGGAPDPDPDPDAVFVHQVQGTGTASPMVGAQVIIEGIVVGDFQGDLLGGFFLQEEDADADADPLSSEGIFVYQGATGTEVAEGDLVRVSGTVAEYFDNTQLSSVSSVEIIATAQPLPAVSDMLLPMLSADEFERYEGMLVRLPQVLTVTENYTLGRYGEVWLSAGGRLMQPTAVALPGDDALAVQAENDLNRLLIDDGRTAQNPDPIIFPAPGLSADNTLRSGDSVAGVVGALNFSFGSYRVQPTTAPSFVASNPRTPAPGAVGGSFKVASFNVLNYFNGDGQGGGFPTARGADTAAEFVRQRDKIISALVALDADVIGLMEIENDGYSSLSAIADLTAGLNAALPAGESYDFVDPGVSQIGSDAIAVGYLYRTQTAGLVGASAILDSSVDPRFDDTKNRPALAQTFEELASGERFTIAVNHLKSKGSSCDSLGDPDTGDGQGNCNLTRTAAAEALADWLGTDPTSSGDDDFLIIGDLNAYAMEDPIAALQAGGYTDLADAFIGADVAYSYIFDGQAGYLDYALANDALLAQVTGVHEWHINTDEPIALDYNVEFKSPGQIDSLYDDGPYRASDHDPVVIGLALQSGPPGRRIAIADLDGYAVASFGTWTASSVVKVMDDAGQPVAGAEVMGSWIGGQYEDASCVTNASGRCTVSAPYFYRADLAFFVVSDVVLAGATYDAGANSDPDGDSDGHAVEVAAPQRPTWPPR